MMIYYKATITRLRELGYHADFYWDVAAFEAIRGYLGAD